MANTARTLDVVITEIKEVKLPMEGSSNIPAGERVSLCVTESDIICLQNSTGKRWRTTSQQLAGLRIFETADKAKGLEDSDAVWAAKGHKSLQEAILAGTFTQTTSLTCVGRAKRVDREHPRTQYYYKPKAYKSFAEFKKLQAEAIRAPQTVDDSEKAQGIRSSKDLWAEAYKILRDSGLISGATDEDIDMMPLFIIL